ncbi:MAG: hypothetical protein ABIH69_06450 [bacterium]|nr:hypothetical protein [Candidatus Margulisiibacteriota bacterium]
MPRINGQNIFQRAFVVQGPWEASRVSEALQRKVSLAATQRDIELIEVVNRGAATSKLTFQRPLWVIELQDRVMLVAQKMGTVEELREMLGEEFELIDLQEIRSGISRLEIKQDEQLTHTFGSDQLTLNQVAEVLSGLNFRRPCSVKLSFYGHHAGAMSGTLYADVLYQRRTGGFLEWEGHLCHNLDNLSEPFDPAELPLISFVDLEDLYPLVFKLDL